MAQTEIETKLEISENFLDALCRMVEQIIADYKLDNHDDVLTELSVMHHFLRSYKELKMVSEMTPVYKTKESITPTN